MMITTGMATRTGVMVRYRSMPRPAGTPWSCRTTRPTAAAAQPVSSATGRRQAGRDLLVSAVVTRAGLAAGAGLRCCQAAISGGPASAVATATPASHHPADDETAPPGITALASAAPASAAG